METVHLVLSTEIINLDHHLLVYLMVYRFSSSLLLYYSLHCRFM